MPDHRARMDIDACLAMRHLGNHPRDIRHAQLKETMRDPIVGDGPQAGITKDHLPQVCGRGITIERRLGIGGQQVADRRQGLEETLRQLLRTDTQESIVCPFALFRETEAGIDLLDQQTPQRGDMHANMKTDTLAVDPRPLEIAGKQDHPAQADNLAQHLAGGQLHLVRRDVTKTPIRALVRQAPDHLRQPSIRILSCHISNRFSLYDKCTILCP